MGLNGNQPDIAPGDIAIVGMSAHLPGSTDIEGYWRNLRDGVCSIRRLSPSDLDAAGEAPHMVARPDYVPFAAPLDGFADFDADFFGFSPKEAAIMDPQHRQFLECAWEAMEAAGHVPAGFPGPIGVFAGCGMGSYFYFNLCSNPDLVEETGMFLLRHTGNDKDFLSTRASHVFDLHGPSVNVQTACSTSLVAVHYAAQALLSGECDMALAGGVTVELPQGRGYLYKEGEILSPDGQCHAFDHRAEGTVFGSGAGVLVLRRLADALADGDHVWAVIKGTAVNNDGAAKAGYLAPSVDGQAAAIAEAHEVAGVTANTIDYVECHGTGTYLGDPIEVTALTEAFRRTTEAEDFCRIGSVKTNIGHLDTAAGAASLIKAALALHHKQMPPSLGYEKANPAIPFEGSPFAVNDRLRDWPASDHPRRAGVNSLGVGGTNAHAVVQEAPERPASEKSDWPFQLLTLSAKSKAALDAASLRLADHLEAHPEQPLADVAFTLKEGRHGFERRRVIVAGSHAEAAATLREGDPRRVFTHTVVGDDPDVVFMFPGGGAQYADMGRVLYETEPEFRDWMDRGLDHLATLTGGDPRKLWLGRDETALLKPSVQLPLIMVVEYALARTWMAWGVEPAALIGHSMGENTAAAVAGVMSFEDCIGLVHLRGSLFDTVEPGGMLSVALPADKLQSRLGAELDLAAVNAPGLSVATGPQAALTALQLMLVSEDIDCQRIPIDIAAHSRMLDPILDRFGAYLRGLDLKPPQIPFVSNRTGTWITAEEATDPDYWVGHLRGTVRFADGLTTLSAEPNRLYIEVGPGKALSSLAGQHGVVTANQVIGSLRHPKDEVADDAYFMAMLGRVWAAGGSFDWSQVWGEARRNRVPLPTYAFQRSRYFIEPGVARSAPATDWLMRVEDREQWGWAPVWKPTYADLPEEGAKRWLVFSNSALTEALVERLRGDGHEVAVVRPGDGYARLSDGEFRLAIDGGRQGYEALMADLAETLPERIVHGWLVTEDEGFRPGSSFFQRLQDSGFWSLVHLAQSWPGEEVGVTVLTSDAERYPAKSTVMGPARVLPRELPQWTVRVLDLPSDSPVEPVLEEVLAPPANEVARWAEGVRSVQVWRHAVLPEGAEVAERAVVMLTGGFGGIGLTVAVELMRRHRARIVLLTREALPHRDDWDRILDRTAPTARLTRKLRAIRALEAAGGEVMALAADVANVEEMRRARAAVEARWGRVDGVIHAAGVIDDAPVLAKSASSVERVLAPKVHGTTVLDEVFPDGSIDWLVLFSSSSTATAPAGQVDYVAANEYLNAVARARRGGRTKVRALAWGVWSEVGMAADAMAARQGGTETPFKPVEAPLLDSRGFDAEGNRVFAATWTARDRWVLDEHRTKRGDALLPGTGYFELIAEALHLQGETGAVEVRGLTFLRPLRVDDTGATEVRVTLARRRTGYDLRVESAGANGVFQLNAEGELRLRPMAVPDPIDLSRIAARCPRATVALPGETLRAPQEAHLAFGPRWRVLTETRLGEGEGLARLRLPPGDSAFHLHPGLMDIATGWAMGLIEGYRAAHLWVPVSYGSVRVHGALPAEVTSWVRNAGDNRSEAGTATFDVTLAAPDGTVVVEIRGFTIRRMETSAAFAAPPATQPSRKAPPPLSPAEERLRHDISQGILPADGAAMFFRALASDRPEVLISSLDLTAAIERAGQAARDSGPGQTFDRPQLDGDYVAPEGEIETRLAAIWSELLGVSQVGVEDGFFDLGGHSLIAVRLFATIKRTWGVDFPISILFEAPTIRATAALIAAEVGEVASPDAPARPAPVQHRHLVALNQSDEDEAPPLFIVAGMFGNVLNLRSLAVQLEDDRRVFGLQARGLIGDEAPHETIGEAAEAYLAEVRRVQPHGPYLLSGFSGGGITAYDMAQRLTAEGEEVAVLALLDTPLPVRPSLTRRDKALIKLAELRRKGPGYLAEWWRARRAWQQRDIGGPEEPAAARFNNARIEAAFRGAVAQYEVAPWDGPVTLFRPPLDRHWAVSGGRFVSAEREYVLHDNDWTRHAPRIEVIEVPGDHDSMVLPPNVAAMATHLREVIDAALDAPRPVRLKAAE